MIIDVVDATEASDRHEVETIKKAGGDPIVYYAGLCGAVGQVVSDIMRRAETQGSIGLLRFHGHGAPGMMNIAAGKQSMFQHQSGISLSNLSGTKAELCRLKPYFAKNGRVEFHGCNVAEGPDGQSFLLQLAKIFGVPVSAGTQSQYGGGAKQFKFEGPVHTAKPDGSMMCGLPVQWTL
jgi:hypothetical protein